MKKDLNLIEQKKTKKSKGIKNLVVCAGAVAVLCSNIAVGIEVYDANFDHTEEICPLTNVLGLQHQVKQINRQSEYIAFVEKDVKVVSDVDVSYEQKLVDTKHIPYEIQAYQTIIKPVHHSEDGNDFWTIEYTKEPCNYTFYKDEPVYENIKIEKEIFTNIDRIAMYNKDFEVEKTLILK